jgi:hypothetical protein
MILRRKPLTLMTAIIIVIGVAAVMTTTGAYAQLSPPSSSQQNMTSLNATNATAVVAINNTTAATAPTPTRIITQLIGVRGEVIPLHMENIQFQQEDPLFAKLVQVINDCMNFVVAQHQEGHIDQLDNNRKFACDSVISLGVEQFCGFSPRSDVLECAEANQMQLYYMVTAQASGFPT